MRIKHTLRAPKHAAGPPDLEVTRLPAFFGMDMMVTGPAMADHDEAVNKLARKCLPQ